MTRCGGSQGRNCDLVDCDLIIRSAEGGGAVDLLAVLSKTRLEVFLFAVSAGRQFEDHAAAARARADASHRGVIEVACFVERQSGLRAKRLEKPPFCG